jgi:putative two-component system response regulator
MSQIEHAHAHIVIVDDLPINVRLLEIILAQEGYTCVTSFTNPLEMLSQYAELKPDLVLLDLHMPQLDGYAVLEELRRMSPRERMVPIVVLTADETAEAKRRVLSYGAKDFLTKPFDAVEVLLRIKNLLETQMLYRQEQQHNQTLEQRVQERTQELEAAQYEIISRLARAAEYRDDDTGQHTQRVGLMVALVAERLGFPSDQVGLLQRAAPLHDIGKIGISDTILLKPARLEPEEFAIMKTHTTIGGRILAGSQFMLLRVAEEITLTHHERWDGCGYPYGLSGASIPLPGRIVAIADVYDALTHARPYKPAWTVEDAVAEIQRQRGRQFDPQVVDAFMAVLDTQPAIQ